MSSGQELNIPVPEGTSEKSIERIESRYKEQIERFGELLIELDKTRFRQTGDGIQLPIPDSIDDETLNRVRAGYDKEILKFSQFLFELDRARLLPETDSLHAFQKKQQEIYSMISKWNSHLRNLKASESKMLMNYVYFCNSVCPRLSGRVIQVGSGDKQETLKLALSNAKSGDTLALGPGTFELDLSSLNQLEDVEIRGHESGDTVVKNIWANRPDNCLTRIRFKDLTFDCQGNELSLGRNSFVELQNCSVSNFNNRRGGDGLSGRDCFLLLEDCVLNGGGDEQDKAKIGGNALNFRGNDYFYIRNTRFLDTRQISVRNAVFDNCSLTVSSPDQITARFQYVSGNIVKVRNSELGQRHFAKPAEFDLAFDDPEFAHKLWSSINDESKTTDGLADAFDDLKLRHNIQYWIGMIRAKDPAVRQIAAQRVTKLTGQIVNLPKLPKLDEETKQKIASLIESLNDGKARVREEATEELKGMGKSTTTQLKQIYESGTTEQRARSKMILESLIDEREVEIEKEIGRLLNWFDESKDKLIYDKEADTYKVKP